MSNDKIGVGVIGLGMMGLTHLDAYAERSDVSIAAVADADANRLHGKVKAQGNVEGQASGKVDLTAVAKYADGFALIADPAVEVVDICLPTPLHRRFADAALAAGKPILVEKPLARTAADGFALADAAEKSGRVAMPAMCMRFWPGWDWLKAVTEQGTYGALLSVGFRRLTSQPAGAFYRNGEACGGAILDLHIHDSDFVQFLLGMPQAVFSRGYRGLTGEVDHVVTHYLFPGGPLVTAEGSWALSDGFGFHLSYLAHFERATAVYELGASPVLKLIREGVAEPVPLPDGTGYQHEIDYFLGCVREGRPPRRVTIRDAARSVAIVEAERQSIVSGQAVDVGFPSQEQR